MRNFFLAAVLTTTAILGGCGAGEEKKASLDAPVTVDRHVIGTPVTSGNISIYPVTLASAYREVKKPQPLDDVVSMQTAKENNWIVISEADGGMQVDSVKVSNTGPKKVLLMTGELLIGGHQDRVVGADTVIEPGKTVNVPVFCVEAGRSTGPTDKFTLADHSVPLSVKTAAITGKQETVWSNVAVFNSAAGMTDKSVSTVNAGLRMERVQERLKTGYDAIWSKLSKNDEAIGAIIVIDGKIRTLELFGAMNIFRGGMPTILRGALADAAVSPIETTDAVDAATITEFVKTAMRKAEREAIRANDSGPVTSSRMSGYLMPRKGADPIMVHGSFLNVGK